MPATPFARWIRLVRPQDLVWVLLFAALGYTTPHRDIYELGPLAALAFIQIFESKIPGLETRRGRISRVFLKLFFTWIFIGYTDAIYSGYWPLMLVPVLSAATTLGALGTLLFSIFTFIVYLSFVFWPQRWADDAIAALLSDPAQITLLALRCIFLAMAGNLANILAEHLRIQSEKHRRAAEQLADANVHIREAEEAVRRSDRLAALGQLSAGLAHELRNPLGTIKASSEMLGRSVVGENEVAREMSGFIASEVDRANSLITRFLQFARPLQPRLENGDISQTLDRAIAMVQREAPGIAIYTNYAPEIPPFAFDSELMERVFYNLILNAAQASPAAGTVTVKTRAAAGTVEISVIDRGSGIEPKHLETIFNPFFTTKAEGVGLGLAIVSKIVDEHGGKITVESEPSKGSVFRVLLPLDRLPNPAT